MWRLIYRLLHALSGLFFWFRKRVAPAGKIAVGVAIIAAALGVDTGQTMAYQIFALAVIALVVALLVAKTLRPRVEVERTAPRLVTAGQSFRYRVSIRNASDRAAGGLTLIEDPVDPRPSLAAFRASARLPSYRGWWRLVTRARRVLLEEARVPELQSGERIVVEVQGHARRRGTFEFTGASVAQADPLGLMRAVVHVSTPGSIVVLPRRYALNPAALTGARRYQHGGVSLASSVGDSGEFIGLREYRPGDPLQRIHWKSFARLGEPVVREFQDEFFERHALVLDTFAGPRAHEAFEEAVSVAASFACTLDTQESLLDLLFVGAQAFSFTAGRGQLQVDTLVEILAGVLPCTDRPFADLAQTLLSRREALSGCILILLDCDAPRVDLVRRLQLAGVALRVLLVTADAAVQVPAGWHWLQPGRIQEGLARL